MVPEKFIIHGGTPLYGSVKVNGSKNAALPILCAALLTKGRSIIRNVPKLMDVESMLKLLETLGVCYKWLEGNTLQLEVVDDEPYEAPYDLVSQMRASICVLGPLLARRGKAKVARPGGCNIGIRPINLHIKGLQALGAEIWNERGYVMGQAIGLRGRRIYLGGPNGSTVSGTANVMMAATLAKGTTVIVHAACELVMEELARYLNACGAKIHGAGTTRIIVEGTEELHGAEHTVIPDRIEAGTFVIAAALTGGSVRVEGARPDHLFAVIDVLEEAGVSMELERDCIHVLESGDFQPVDVTALPYPGFPTDLQSQMTTLLSLAKGISVVTEKVYPDRFIHVAELNRMGARIRKEGNIAIIRGVNRLYGAPVMASDLRASACLVLAGLVAEGITEVRKIHHIDRGYEKIEERLRSLGAEIYRVPQEVDTSVYDSLHEVVREASPRLRKRLVEDLLKRHRS